LASINEWYTSERHTEALDRMRDRPTGLMKQTDGQIGVESGAAVDKTSVFIGGRRCSTCHGYKREATAVRESLHKYVNAQTGESLTSVIESLAKKHEQASEEVVQLSAVNRESAAKFDELEQAGGVIVRGIETKMRGRGVAIRAGGDRGGCGDRGGGGRGSGGGCGGGRGSGGGAVAVGGAVAAAAVTAVVMVTAVIAAAVVVIAAVTATAVTTAMTGTGTTRATVPS